MIGSEMTQQEIEALVKDIPGDFVVYCLTGRQMKVLFFTPSILGSFGISAELFRAATARDALDVVMPGDREYVLESVLGQPVGPREINCVFRLIHLQKGFFWVHSKSRIIGTKDGCPVILTNYLDSSAEAESYSRILDDTETAFYTVDFKTHDILYANRAARQRAKVPNSAIYAGHPCFEYQFGRTAPCPGCPMPDMVPGAVVREERRDPESGAWHSISRKRVTWCNHDCMEVFVDDITAEKKREEQARSDSLRYRLAIKGAHLSVWEYDIKTRRMLLQGEEDGFSAIRAHGYTARSIENFPESVLDMLLTDKDRRALLRMFDDIRGGQEYVSEELWLRAANAGEQPWCERVAYYVTRDAQGEPSIAYGVGQDITVEKQEKAKFQNTFHELLAANPKALCTFRLNLSKNRCTDEHGTSPYIQRLLTTDTADRLFENIAGIIDNPAERQGFCRLFNRSTLLEKYSRGESKLSFNYRRRMEDGSNHWVNTSMTMLRNPSTNDIEAIIYSVDIDDSVKEESIIRCIVQEEFDSIAIINVLNGSINFRVMQDAARGTTPHACPLYNDDIRYAFPLVDPDHWEEDVAAISLERLVQELKSTNIYTYAFTMQDPAGRVYRKLLKFCYVDESKEEILLSRNDITTEYEQHKRQLAEVRSALDEADRANEMKSLFLSNVSHDMRTPLNAVLGYAALARQSSDQAVKNDYLEKISRAGSTLLSLINDTLDLQKIETGTTTLKPAPASCGDVLSGIATAVRPMMDRKHIDFVIDSSRAVMATINVDAMRLQEVFINLLSNSAKFTPEGGRVELTVECLKLEQHCVHDRLTVRDNGIGISEEFLPRIFEPFAQERTKDTMQIEGTGLGLTIVHDLVSLMGGHIEVESQPGKGTTFTVCLDFERLDDLPGAAGRQAEDEAARQQLAGMKVLLCEDNDMNTEIAKALLEMRGIKVTCARNGQEGAEVFARSKPGDYDAILMDIRMPVLNGYEATKLIRASAHPMAARIPIIAMSADAYEDDVQRCMLAGMNSHISKPIDPARLFSELNRLRP